MALLDHIKRTAEKVKSWPAWKREVFDRKSCDSIHPTPILRGKHARRFEQQLAEDLKHSVGLVPTPKLDGVRAQYIQDMEQYADRLKMDTHEDLIKFLHSTGMYDENGDLKEEFK